MYEVLDASINLHLNDQDAILGVERVRTTVKRNMKAIGRERAKVIIEGDLKNLKKDLKEAQALLKAHREKVKQLEKDRKDLSGAALGWNTRRLNAAKAELATLEQQVAQDKKRASSMQDSLSLIKERHRFEQLETRELREHERLERAKAQAVRATEKARIDEKKQVLEISKLQERYIKAGRDLNKVEQERTRLRGRFRQAVSPAIHQEVELRREKAIAEMEALRIQLEAMGQKPVEIHTELDRRGGLGALANIGDIGTRIGPFSGTLAQFAKASLILGPALVGLVGSVGALAGAIGTGLTGALGVGAAAAGAFGLSLGGVGLLTASLFRDFKNLNTMQAAYHKQVLKTGKNSEKAKTKLEEFNHALGEVTPTARKSFEMFGKLQDRWRGLRREVKPDFLNALGETFKTLNTDFKVFGDGTTEAFRRVTKGWNDWMRAARSPEAQSIIGNLMHEANAAIPPLMRGLGDLAAAGAKLAVSFGRFLRPLFKDFADWAEGVNRAASNTDKLDRGTGKLYRSFRQVWSVLTATTRVLAQFALTAMGPGGHLMDDLADGLNGVADAIAADRAGENRLGKFLSESVTTTEQLYRALQPLLKLFVEWSTALRPVTDVMLQVIEQLGKFLNLVVDKVPGAHALLAGMGTLWLFRKTPAAALTVLAQSLNLVAAGLLRVGKAQKAAAGLQGAAGALSARAVGGAAAGTTAGAAGGAAGGSLIGGALRGLGGVGTGAMVAGAVRGGIGGALLQSVTRGIGGTLLQGVMRAGIWGAIGVGAFKGIKAGFDRGVKAGAMEMSKSLVSTVTLGMVKLDTKDYAAIDRRITDDIDRIEKLAQQHARAKKLGIDLDVNFKTDEAKSGLDLLLGQIERTKNAMASSIGQAKSDLRMNMRAIKSTMSVNSQQGKEAVAANFRAVAAEIKRGVNSGAIDTKKGMDLVHQYLVKALTTLGLTTKGANRYLKGNDPLTGKPTQGSPYVGKAVGGYIGRAGAQGRDLIPLMVGEGEAVVNRHQQGYIDYALQAMGMRGGLAELFQREQRPHYAATGYYNKRKRTTSGPRENELGFASGGKAITLPRYRTRSGGLLGRVTQGTVDTYRAAAQAKARQIQQQAGGFLGLGKGAVMRGGASLARMLGLTVTSTTGGKHAVNSWHYKGRAIDAAGSPGQMMQFFRAAAGKWGRHILELFYDPAGYYIKNGARVTGAIGGHSDHVHLAMARGGFAAKGKAPSLRGQALSRILKRAPGLSMFNRQYARNKGETLTPDVIRAIAEAAGFSPTEALHMMQISKGESSFQPGAVSDDGGFGLWQNTPRVWGPKAKAFLAKLGGQSALMNPLLNAVMARFLYNDRKSQGKDPLGPWYGTKFLRRGSRAKGSILSQFQTGGSLKNITEPLRHGRRMDMANLMALDEANLGRAGRTRNLADDIWATGVRNDRLAQQNKQSRARIKTIDKKLAGPLRASDRSSLLQERAGLITSIEANKQTIFDSRKEARDKLFELQRGKGNRRVDIDYRKSMAESTKSLDDDIKVAEQDRDYWAARLKFLKDNHASLADITEAQNNVNAANNNIVTLQDQQKQDMENAKRTELDAGRAIASLTPDLNDDLAAAQAAEGWIQSMYDLAAATGDTEGIAKWGPELKSARDEVSGITEQINLLGPQLAQTAASLTNDLNDDVSAAQMLVDYWQGIYNAATGAEKVSAGQNLAGARSDLQSAKRNAELLPLERDQALAALTDTLDDDKAAMIALRDYWKGQLDAATASGDIQGQIEAANNLKGLNDQIKDAQKSVMEQMIVLSEARRDLYRAFSNNMISQVPAGTLAPGGSTTYNGGTTVNVTNNFQAPPEDPLTWSAGISWELQAAV